MNAFEKRHPVVLLFYFTAVLMVAMFMENPAVSVSALLGGMLFCAVWTTAREKREDVCFYVPLFFLLAVTNPLFSHNGVTPLFFMNGNAVTLEAVIYGAAIAVMVVGVMLWCKNFGFVMSSDKIVYLFGRVIPKLSLVVMAALRYIPMLKRRAREVGNAQRALGLYSTDSYFDRVRAALSVFSALIGWSMEAAVETGRAMRARGYGLKGRRCYSDYRWRGSDRLLLFVGMAALAWTLGAGVSGAVGFSYYPRITPLPAGAYAVSAYFAYAVLAFLPFLIEVEENIRWSYYRSKI